MVENVALCIVGSEVLNGYVVDTNTGFFCRELYGLGIKVKETRIIPDDSQLILKTWQELIELGYFIINTGGLGPTEDDMTVDLLCEFLGVTAIADPYAEKRASYFFKKRVQQEPNEEIKTKLWQKAMRQVRLPEGTMALKNKVGLAPGIYCKEMNLIALPGFPIEIQSIWPEAKEIISTEITERLKTIEIPIWGIGESALFSKLDIDKSITVGVHALPLGSKLFLQGRDLGLLAETRKIVEEKFYGLVVRNPLHNFVEYLKLHSLTLSTVESCTGGLLAKLLTDLPGVSAVYKGSVVSYANSVKESLLKVLPDSLKEFGAVSETVAYEMAVSGLTVLDTDFAISTTGVAGPTGGTSEKPVGTVYIGIAVKGENKVWVGKFSYPMGRERFREAVVYTAFLSLYQKMVLFKDDKLWREKGWGEKFQPIEIK